MGGCFSVAVIPAQLMPGEGGVAGQPESISNNTVINNSVVSSGTISSLPLSLNSGLFVLVPFSSQAVEAPASNKTGLSDQL